MLFLTSSLQGSNRHALTSGNKVIGFPKSLSSCHCLRGFMGYFKGFKNPFFFYVIRGISGTDICIILSQS